MLLGFELSSSSDAETVYPHGHGGVVRGKQNTPPKKGSTREILRALS